MAVVHFRGPDVLVIGWIPFHMTPPAAAGFPAGAATTALFNSGNPKPPIAFRGYAGFADWIHPVFLVGSQEYRAAVYLEAVEAEFPDDGSAPRADYGNKGAFPGYTPYRLFSGTRNILRAIPYMPRYGHGYGPQHMPTLARDPGGNWVELHYKAEFKLSYLGNMGSRLLTHFWAPYAWCEIIYRFERTGHIDIRVEGSAIPNRWLYISWSVPSVQAGIVPEYDMLTAPFPNVQGFIRTSGWGCSPAPPDPNSDLRWSGQGSSV